MMRSESAISSKHMLQLFQASIPSVNVPVSVSVPVLVLELTVAAKSDLLLESELRMLELIAAPKSVRLFDKELRLELTALLGSFISAAASPPSMQEIPPPLLLFAVDVDVVEVVVVEEIDGDSV